MACAEASDADLEFKEAVGFAREGENDFAFMDFQTVLNECPGSRHCLASDFALGEYYFLQNNWQMASDQFETVYAKYPRHEEALIALAYLYQIAKIQDHKDDMEKYRGKAAAFRQLTFIFNDQKVYTFLSGFQRLHELVYTINKVDIYVNGQLFTEVPF